MAMGMGMNSISHYDVVMNTKISLSTDGNPNLSVIEVPMLKKFTGQDIERIAANGEKIGEGGYGKVYLGKLDNGVQVAVKTLLELSESGVEGFQAEVNALTRVHHKNLVKFIGYCADKRYPALVYEYMEGRSLRDHLSDEGKRSQLSWRNRLQIAFEVAEGLKYLHKDCDPPIIHRDIKPGNILLTKDLEAKIGDFGLSKIFKNESVNAPAIVEANAPPSHMLVTAAAGTPGYRDPEYVLRDKNDVYSFGVVLMQLITGLHAFIGHDRNIHITDWVRERVSSSEIKKIIDETINQEYDEKSVLGFAKVAMECARTESQERPDIIKVVKDLEELCTAYDESTRKETRDRPDITKVVKDRKDNPQEQPLRQSSQQSKEHWKLLKRFYLNRT